MPHWRRSNRGRCWTSDDGNVVIFSASEVLKRDRAVGVLLVPKHFQCYIFGFVIYMFWGLLSASGTASVDHSTRLRVGSLRWCPAGTSCTALWVQGGEQHITAPPIRLSCKKNTAPQTLSVYLFALLVFHRSLRRRLCTFWVSSRLLKKSSSVLSLAMLL